MTLHSTSFTKHMPQPGMSSHHDFKLKELEEKAVTKRKQRVTHRNLGTDETYWKAK